jgi:hypothetical protein
LVTQALELDPSLAGPWRALVDDPREDRAEELLERMRDLRAGQATREVMVREGWAALAALQSLDDGAYRTALERLASGLMRAPYDTLTVVTP